jgi:hypothetical protein
MTTENWLKEEANKAKKSTNDWPEWRKQSVTSSKAYAYTDQKHCLPQNNAQNAFKKK